MGTSAGLDRFRKGALVPTLLPTKFTLKALVAGDDGDIWVGATSNALARIEGNTWRNIEPGRDIVYGFRDSRDVLWFLNRAGDPSGFPFLRVLRLEQGRLTVFAKTSPDIHESWLGTVLAVDRSGTLWVGNGPRSLFFLKNGHWERFETPPAVVGKRARVTFTDTNGRVWFGFTDNTILLIDGPNVRTFSAKDGIQVGSIMAITGRGRHIWIAGEGGLAVWEEDRFRTVAPADSDAFHGVSGVQEDSAGNLFLSEQRGVLLIPGTEVSKIIKDRSARVRYRVFDAHDGLPGAIQQTPPYPTAVQGTDGRIWFSTSAGVAWINPAHIPRNLLPPPIVIRSITANGTRHTSATGLKLPPRTRDLTIDYTALSLAIPERVRFRYKLEGSDTQWQDVGTRRQAFYTNLTPGQYLFRVAACNNDGVWNEAGAAWSFSIAPTFYETVWFRTLIALVSIGLTWLLYRFRLRQITARADLRHAERLEERTRIGRELHDTLLQSFQGLMLHLQVVNELLPEGKAKEQLEQSLQRADQAIAERRSAVYDLRSSAMTTNDLAHAVRALGNELATQDTAAFRLVVEGPPRDMDPIVRDELYRITREALRNAFSHARAHNIEVEITYSERLLRLRIRDDGDGIAPEILEEGRSGHYGLPGMRERAQKIGAKLEIWSGMRTGTEIDLSIAGSIAYRASPARPRFRFFKKPDG